MRPSARHAERGSVTVYFIAAVSGFVLIGALLIDFARIAAFRYQAETAIHAGVRSALSAYDPDLYARYGLFVRGGEDAAAMMTAAAEGYFPQGRSGFAYLDAAWTAADATESRPLADHDVFRRGVLEEMKYKAPIDLALDLASRFRGVAPALRQAADATEALQRMGEAYDRREAALDAALASQRAAGGEVLAELADPLLGQARTLGSAADLRAWADALTQASSSIASAAEEHGAAAHAAWRQAHGAEREIRAIGEAGGSAPSVEPQSAELPDVRKSAEQLLRGEAYFESYEQELSAQLASGTALGREAARIAEAARTEAAAVEAAEQAAREAAEQAAKEAAAKAEKAAKEAAEKTADGLDSADHADADIPAAQASPAVIAIPVSTAVWEQSADRLRSMAMTYRSSYGESGSVLARRQEGFAGLRSREGERQALEQEAKTAWSGWQGWIGRMAGGAGSDAERQAFEALHRLTLDNLAWNRREDTVSPDATGGSSKDPAGGRRAAMASAKGWFDALDGSAGAVRDSVYVSEYAVSKLNFFAPAQAKRLLDGEQVELLPERQEIEYVLYGRNSPTGNLAAAYGEVFAFRLSVRILEGLIEYRSLGHPLVVLAAATVYGIRQAAVDMQRLLTDDRVPLSKYAAVSTTYRDYLRLFLLVHGGSDAALSRMIAVLERESGISFSEAYTYVSGEGTASLRLWFFPGLLRMMERVGTLGGTVKGNRYEATYRADSSYL